MDADILQELAADMPSSADIPDAATFVRWLSDGERIRSARETVLSELGGGTCTSDRGVLFHGNPVMQEFHAEEFNALCTWCAQKS